MVQIIGYNLSLISENTYSALVTQTITKLDPYFLLEEMLWSIFQMSYIDNVSVKEVRATTVEASKCLADAIHRIGIQDIQN